MSSRQYDLWRQKIARATGGDSSAARAPGARDIFRARLQAASDANQAAIANRNDALARKLEELRNTPLAPLGEPGSAGSAGSSATEEPQNSATQESEEA